MSRALAGVVALALIFALNAAIGSGAGAGSARAASAGCVWQQHSKRIVRHLKRDGRSRRLVRIRRWRTCESVAAPPPITLPAPAPATIPAPPPVSPPISTIERLGVKAEEWSLILSHSTVAPGEVIVELNNEGSDSHNLKLQREGDEGPPLEVAEARSKEHRTARFTLAAGTYQLWCSLPEHKEKGMSVTLEVTAD